MPNETQGRVVSRDSCTTYLQAKRRTGKNYKCPDKYCNFIINGAVVAFINVFNNLTIALAYLIHGSLPKFTCSSKATFILADIENYKNGGSCLKLVTEILEYATLDLQQ